MKKGLTRASAIALLSNVESALKKRSSAELSNSETQKVIKGELAKSVGMDVEEFSLNIGSIKDIDKQIPDKAKVIGNLESNYDFKPAGSDVESFDAINTTHNEEVRLAAINIVSANYTNKEDGFLSLFTRETIDAKTVGKEIKAFAPNITVGSEMVNGQSIGGEKVSLISNLDNSSIFGSARIPYTPVLRTTGDYATASFLDEDLAATIVYNGEDLETAPLLVGKTIPLRRVCSTTNYLTVYKDQFNPAITLAPDGGVKAVVLKLTGDAGLINELVLPVSGEKSSKYGPKKNAKEKDLTLSFTTTQRIAFSKLPELVKYTSTADTYVAANAGGELIEVDVQFTFTASVNTDTMIYTSSATSVEVINVLNNGVELAGGTRRNEIIALFGAGVISAVEMNHYLSNTNNLENGIIIDVEAENFIIPAVYRIPATINKSILGEMPDEDVTGYIAAAKIALNSQKVAEAISMVDEFIDSVEGKTDVNTGIVTNYVSNGVGSNYIKPLVLKFPVNATNSATRRSFEKKDDIARHIYDAFINRAIKAFNDSNLNKAVDALLPNEEVTFVMVAGGNLTSYLTSAAASDEGADKYPFKIEVQNSLKTGNKVYAGFRVGKTINELSPMVLVESPDHVYKAVQTSGNGTAEVTKMIPRRGMELNAPVLLVGEVTGVIDAFDD